jgi:hypothetical protein
MSYYESTASTYISNGYDRGARLRAVATNSVREAVIAAGRIDQPYTDNDAAILENIYNLLLRIVDNVDKASEHQNLSVANTAPAVTQSEVALLLDSIDDTVRAETTTLVKAKVPAAKA